MLAIMLPARLGRQDSGRVISGDWDLNPVPVTQLTKIRCALLHWERGVPWEETGVYEHLLDLIERHGPVDGCSNLDDIVDRYRRLDLLFNDVRRTARLLSQADLGKRALRESGGIYFHFGRDGSPLFGHGGNHRLALAIALKLDVVPVQVGVVHAEAVFRWRQSLARA